MAKTEPDFLVITGIFPNPATAQTPECAGFTADFGGSCLNPHVTVLNSSSREHSKSSVLELEWVC